jgi:hypothetical protein
LARPKGDAQPGRGDHHAPPAGEDMAEAVRTEVAMSNITVKRRPVRQPIESVEWKVKEGEFYRAVCDGLTASRVTIWRSAFGCAAQAENEVLGCDRFSIAEEGFAVPLRLARP